ncbi:MAG TPA: hypothetical protein VF498_20280, partial [Anaerolineales bacterium]
VFKRRRERYLDTSQPGGGQIAKDLDNLLARVDGPLGRLQLIQLLMYMPQGTRASFDKKTHRRVLQRTTRLSYIYYAAQFLDNRESNEVAADVLEHLEQAQDTIRQAWGQVEWQRLGALTMAELSDTSQRGLQAALGEELYAQAANQPIQTLSASERDQVINELGRQAITEIYRQLILAVVTELWVDYLTQMEALRVAIGLEAYAQRDPLVQYKSRAFELFQGLLNDMRLGVVSRMFTYQPSNRGAVQASAGRAEAAEADGAGDNGSEAALSEGADAEEAAEEVEETGPEPIATAPKPTQEKPVGTPPGGSKKKKRRRH